MWHAEGCVLWERRPLWDADAALSKLTTHICSDRLGNMCRRARARRLHFQTKIESETGLLQGLHTGSFTGTS